MFLQMPHVVHTNPVLDGVDNRPNYQFEVCNRRREKEPPVVKD
jgi:hypothetical protein